MTQTVAEAEAAVKAALDRVHDANQEYIKACQLLHRAKMQRARDNPHPWLGHEVYKIMECKGAHPRLIRGIVTFKDFDTPDYGNPHIVPGMFFVLVKEKTAFNLDESWQVELF